MRGCLALAALLLAAPAHGDEPDAGEIAAAPDPDAPTVGASMDRTEALVGDRLTLTLSAVARSGVAVTLPAKLDLGKLEVLDRSDGERGGLDIGDGRRSHRFVLGVAAYEVGELEVPPVALSYLNPRGEVRTIETSPIALHIRTLVDEQEAKPAVQPPRPPRSALVEDERVLRALRWGGAALGGALAMGLIMLAVRRGRRRHLVEEAPAAPGRPADEVALERLRALREFGGFAADGYRPFYFAVAEIVRAYLGGRYRFDSLELTTTELIVAVANVPGFHHTKEVAAFLVDTDLVKFAKAGSTDENALAVLDAAEAIVRATAPQPAAAAVPAPAVGGPDAG